MNRLIGQSSEIIWPNEHAVGLIFLVNPAAGKLRQYTKILLRYPVEGYESGECDGPSGYLAIKTYACVSSSNGICLRFHFPLRCVSILLNLRHAEHYPFP